MSQQSRIFRAPAGIAWIEGEQVAKLTDFTLNVAATEITAKAGCDKYDWFTAIERKDLTGSFSCYDLSPSLLAVMVGGAEVSGAGYAVTTQTGLSPVAGVLTFANTGAIHQDSDSEYQIALTRKASAGETLIEQIAGTPGSGQFQVTSGAASATVAVNASDTGASVTWDTVYMELATSRDYWKDTTTAEPGYVSLGIPICGHLLSTIGTETKSTIWLPKVRILSWDLSASAGAGELQKATFNFKAVPDSNNIVIRIY
jgi:hypothetical protein